MTDEFMNTLYLIILEMERKRLVTRTFRRLNPGRQQAVIQAILAEAGEFGPQDLQSHGLRVTLEVLRVMRFSNAVVIQNIDGVLAKILRTCSIAPHKKQDQEEEK